MKNHTWKNRIFWIKNIFYFHVQCFFHFVNDWITSTLEVWNETKWGNFCKILSVWIDIITEIQVSSYFQASFWNAIDTLFINTLNKSVLEKEILPTWKVSNVATKKWQNFSRVLNESFRWDNYWVRYK